VGQPLIQPTFSGGELSPSLQARVDIERYGNSVKTGKNFLVRPYGGMVNRPGFEYLGNSKSQNGNAYQARIIPFVYNTDIAYVVELTDELARFWFDGALVQATTSTAYNGATVYGVGDLVVSSSIVYRSLQAANTGNTPASSPLFWLPNPPFELATPYDVADLYAIKFTQSADVVFLTHEDYPPQKLSRVTPNSFTIEEFVTKEGPFRDVNANEAFKISSSATGGNVTITANADIFTADMVGLLLYMEAKSLGQVKPWQQGDRAVTVGTIRRSDGKSYRATAIASGGTWVESGSFRPVHQQGREWDGPGDTRTNGTQTWAVGIEWEYLDSGYGIVRLTGYTNATTMTGTVVRTLPGGVVGGLGAPANTWTFSGDGVDTTFAVTGATSYSNADYQVTIDGVLVQPDPNYVPPVPPIDGGGPGGGPDFIEP
jgi:hypothetical protein